MLVVRIRLQCSQGMLKIARLSAMFASAHAASFDAALFERREKLPPMHLRLGERHTAPQDGSMAVGLDADCDQDGAVADASSDTNFLIASVDDEVFDRIDGPVSPGLEFFIEQLRCVADLGAGDFQATELGGDLGDLSGRNSLGIHLRDGQFESSFASLAPFQGGW